MGWEWRCFVPSPLPTAAAALLPAPELELAPECRTDNYLLVDSDEVGIKLRGGGGQLEVKTRKDAKSRLAEKWKKSVDFTEEGATEEDEQAAAQAAADKLFLHADAQTYAHHRTGWWVAVHKRRWQAWVGPVVCEQTEVELQLHKSKAAGGAPVGEPKRYISFALEKASPQELYGAVGDWLGLASDVPKKGWVEHVRGCLGAGAIVGGYPQLLRTVYASVLQTPDSESSDTANEPVEESSSDPV